MESADEGLDNIFDDHESRENNGNDHAPENIGESNNENSAGVKIQPPKRVVKNPRLKFNPERLIGERGIPILVEHFKDVKFKGKGHEKEDLDKLLSKLEHWTHRLFPSMKFEDCLHQIERLGTKRPVQTCLRKIRLDMPILASDFVKDGDEEDDVLRNEDTEPVEADAFDQLLGENYSTSNSNNVDDLVDFNPLSSYSPPQSNPLSESRGQVLGSSISSMTDEQKEKLERNRMLAVERRKARLAALESSELAKESSQCDSHEVSVEQCFDSLLENKESKSRHIYESHSQSNIAGMENVLINNSTSDNLGLDDLMDLVDEEAFDINNVASVSNHDQSNAKLTYKNTENVSNETDNMELHASNLENTLSYNETDIALENKTIQNNEISTVDEENLQLESLIDLVNEEENSSALNHLKNTDVESMDCKEGNS